MDRVGFSVRRGVVAFLLSAALSGGCSPAHANAPAIDDWSTTFRGAGVVPTRMSNASDEPMTVRVEDFYGQIVAQVALAPRQVEIVYLPTGNVRAVIRMERDGETREGVGSMFNVPGDTMAVEWRIPALPP